MKQMGFYINAGACIGCKVCELSCKDKKSLPMGIRLRRVREYGGGEWIEKDGYMVPDNVFTYFVSLSCMHCAKPACLDACPAEAIYKGKDTGIVLIDKERCIGCGSCVDVCPYGAPSLNEQEGKSYKCDMCVDLLQEGKNPVCVDGCLQRVLKVGTMDELRKQYGKVDSVPPMPSGKQTEPSIVITKAVMPKKLFNSRVRNVTEL